MKDHLESSIFGDTEEHHEAAGFEDEHRGLSRREKRRARKEERRGGGKPSIRATPRRHRARARRRRRRCVRRLHPPPSARVLLQPGQRLRRARHRRGAGQGRARATAARRSRRRSREEDVVKTTKAFIEAANADPRSAGIQPGVYALRKQMSAADALAVLVDPKNRITSEVTIPEGLWAKEIYPRLSKATGVPVADYTKAAKDAKALGLPAAAKGNVEGYLFPAGYTFDPGTSAADAAQDDGGRDRQAPRRARRPRGPTGADHDDRQPRRGGGPLREGPAQGRPGRREPARRQDAAPVRLDRQLRLRQARHHDDERGARASDSPYNTYKVDRTAARARSTTPGESAIKAAVSPAAGPWIYFVTTNPETGETKFVETYEEHQQNVREFQAWCQANKGKC